MDKGLITVGQIVNTQGHKGEVRIISLTDFPERFRKNKKVIADLNGELRELTIATARKHKQFIIIKFTEIADMNEAEKLKNCYLKVSEEELGELEEGQYYIFQLLGLEVFNQEGEMIGVIKDIFQTGANDVYLIKGDSAKEILIPATKEVVKEINLAEKKMVIAPLEEYK